MKKHFNTEQQMAYYKNWVHLGSENNHDFYIRPEIDGFHSLSIVYGEAPWEYISPYFETFSDTLQYGLPKTQEHRDMHNLLIQHGYIKPESQQRIGDVTFDQFIEYAESMELSKIVPASTNAAKAIKIRGILLMQRDSTKFQIPTFKTRFLKAWTNHCRS